MKKVKNGRKLPPLLFMQWRFVPDNNALFRSIRSSHKKRVDSFMVKELNYSNIQDESQLPKFKDNSLNYSQDMDNEKYTPDILFKSFAAHKNSEANKVFKNACYGNIFPNKLEDLLENTDPLIMKEKNEQSIIQQEKTYFSNQMNEIFKKNSQNETKNMRSLVVKHKKKKSSEFSIPSIQKISQPKLKKNISLFEGMRPKVKLTKNRKGPHFNSRYLDILLKGKNNKKELNILTPKIEDIEERYSRVSFQKLGNKHKASLLNKLVRESGKSHPDFPKEKSESFSSSKLELELKTLKDILKKNIED